MAPVHGQLRVGFQAFILCGPGVSLNTFTSHIEESPKALLPIANRPMVWYPMEWCHRMGIKDITLIAPKASRAAIERALSQNPHLTTLPRPSPDLLSPDGLTETTGTAEILRLPEVQKRITSDFLLLPCDLVSEVPGSDFLEAWLMNQAALDGTLDSEDFHRPVSTYLGVHGERSGRRGGIAVYLPLGSKEDGIKEEVPDFVAVTPLDEMRTLPIPEDSVREKLDTVVASIPRDVLEDKISADKSLRLRADLIKKHKAIRILNRHRDAHIYFFPKWVKDYAAINTKFMSVSEDLVGWWAKMEWQPHLSRVLGFTKLFMPDVHANIPHTGPIEESIDILSLSSTRGDVKKTLPTIPLPIAVTTDTKQKTNKGEPPERKTARRDYIQPPPLLGYVHPSTSKSVIRRVDNTSLLLATNLRLAKLPSVSDAVSTYEIPSPFAYADKVSPTAHIPVRCTITRADCLVGDNSSVGEKSVIKEAVIGANCTIGMSVRVLKCVIMDGAILEDGVDLQGCILGRRSHVKKDSQLRDCEIQDGNVVEEGTEAKEERFMVFEGLGQDGFTVEEEYIEADGPVRVPSVPPEVTVATNTTGMPVTTD